MLVPTNKPNATNPQSERLTPCIECGVPTPYKTTNRVCCAACSKVRRRESLRKAAEVQRRKKGIAQVKGVEAKCDNCAAVIVLKNIKHRLCEACSPIEALARARAASYAKSRIQGRPERGQTHACANCKERFTFRGPRSCYCEACRVLQKEGKLPILRAAFARWRKKRIATDPCFALNGRMRLGLRNCLRGTPGGKARRRWQVLVGYTVADLKRHIEKQFSKGMSWEGLLQGKIHIDHITPLSSFQFSSADDPDFKVAWGLPNLRPMWAADNIRKKDKRLFLL